LHKNQGIIYIQTMLNNSKSTKVSSLFLCLLFSVFISAQQTSITVKLDSISVVLDSLKEMELIPEYYKTLDLFELTMYKNYPQVLYQTASLWEFVGETRADSIQYRRNLARKCSYLKKINDYEEALNYYRQAHSFGRAENGVLDFYWYVEKQIGSIYARYNDYDQAIYYYKLCIPSLEIEKNYKNLSRVYKDIANCYAWEKNLPLAKYNFEKAGEYAALSKSTLALASHHTGVALFLLENNPLENRTAFFENIEQAKIACKNLEGIDRSLNERLQTIHAMLAEYAFLEKSYDLAKEELFTSLDYGVKYYQSPKSREIAKLYNLLAKVNLAENNHKEVQKNLQKGFKKLNPQANSTRFPKLEQIQRENTFTELYQTQALHYYALYEKSEKEQFLDSCLLSIDYAIYANKDLEQSIVLRNSKYTSVETNKELVKLALLVLERKQNRLGHKIDNALLRRYFDLSKSSIYLDKQKEQNLSKELKKEEQIKLAELQTEVVGLSSMQRTHNNRDSIEQQLTKHQKEIKEIVAPLMYKNFETQTLKNYIEFVEADSVFYIQSDMNPGRLELVSKMNIDKLVDTVLLRIKVQSDLNLTKNLESLGEFLIPFSLPKKLEIHIIADGKLHQIPFGMLRKNGKFLIEEHAVTHQLHRTSTKRNIKASDALKVYCLYPEYEEDPQIQELTMRADLGPLPYAQKEVESIESTLVNVYKSRTMDPATLKTIFSDYDIFHYAGHAIANEDSMYLAIKNENNTIENIREHQIQYVQNNLELICLSACETGVGEFKDGEGIRSISSSFLNGGAKSVLHTLWTVNDKSTADIISLFYIHLKQGMKKSEALRKAKLHFIKNTDQKGLHPYYWAGMVISGDDFAVYSTSQTSTILKAFSAILLVLFVYLITSKRKHQIS